MILKKAQAAHAEEQARLQNVHAERSRWEGMPEWKKTLLQTREQKNWCDRRGSRGSRSNTYFWLS